MTLIKIFMAIACVGHVLCFFCDRAITYTPSGRFGFSYLKDNAKMSELFEGVSLKNQLFSILGGVAALSMTNLGYIAIYEYISDYSAVYSTILLISIILFMVSGTAHHVFCGAIEWFYVKLGRTEEARTIIVDFFKSTISTMYVCFLGVMLFSVTFIVAVASGSTGLPRFACIFNHITFFLLMSPFRIVGSFNLAGAATFLSLLIVLCVI